MHCSKSTKEILNTVSDVFSNLAHSTMKLKFGRQSLFKKLGKKISGNETADHGMRLRYG